MAMWLALDFIVGGLPLFFGIRFLNRVLVGNAVSLGLASVSVAVALIAGGAGGWLLLSARYPWAADLHAVGIPLPIAFHQLIHGVWLDHTGAMGLPAAVANLAFWVGISATLSAWCTSMLVQERGRRSA